VTQPEEVKTFLIFFFLPWIGLVGPRVFLSPIKSKQKAFSPKTAQKNPKTSKQIGLPACKKTGCYIHKYPQISTKIHKDPQRSTKIHAAFVDN
jgi:hypothetical protein